MSGNSENTGANNLSQRANPVDEEQHLLNFLQDRDVNCPLCNYNLRNLSTPKCPECAEDLILKVGTRQIFFGLFLITAAPGIFSGICAIMLLFPLIFLGPPPVIWPYILDAFGLASAVSAIMLYKYRHRFLKLSRSRQIICAILVWLLHIGVFATWILIEIFG